MLLALAAVVMLSSAVMARSAGVEGVPPGDRGSALQSTAPVTLTPELLRKLHPQLAKQLLATTDGISLPMLPIVVVMRAQPDLNSRSINAATAPLERRAALASELQGTATRSQSGVRAQLAEAQQAGRARQVRPLWINNSIAAQVDRATLVALAARDDVALIKPDRYLQWITFDPSSNEEFQRDTTQSAIDNPRGTLRSQQSAEWNIAQIHADRVWSALNVTGTGVVVANIDTGVDWLHPALQPSYRGYNPKGIPLHLYSWADVTGDGTQYPYDGNGHGTHTMGTMVGSGGIGVAPGAKWIAVRTFNNDGYAYDSWIHAAFQWVLAPNGDPAFAPDIVNNSWGNNDGSSEEFRPDVTLLNQAGIIAVFSNGNNGPKAGTVSSPASYPEAFGVGASDPYDHIAGFSSRGPSPFDVVKPDISAPGINIRSSFPGGVYQELDGTSMAAPHVSGVAALLRSAVPTLTITATGYVLTSTAFRPTTDTYPNNEWGWGRVDAFQAMLAVMQTGVLSGVVTRSDNAQPISWAMLHAASNAGAQLDVSVNEAGAYRADVAAAVYTVTAEAFGFVSETVSGVNVITGAATRRDFALAPLPTGAVIGQITDLTGTALLTGSIDAQDTPVSLTVRGAYTLSLPAGTYELRAQAPRHRSVTSTVTVTAGATTTVNFALPDAPSILLVDSGAWYYKSEINYYRQALNDLGYLYTDWSIRNAATDVPPTTTLRAYDVVIWSSPLDSPGVVNADGALDDYLKQGGRLFISGQDIAYYDSYWFGSRYMTNRLLAYFVADNGPGRQLSGAGIYTGLQASIAGAGGADNQAFPDVIASRAPALTMPAFEYVPDQEGGQTVGLCRPYRASYLSYGFEAITDRALRAEVMSRTLGFFARPPVTQYYQFDHTADPLIGPAGSTVTGTFDLYNFDEVATTTFALNLTGTWNVAISPTLMTLPPCGTGHFTLTADIPAGAPFGVSQPITISAHPIVPLGSSVSTTWIAKSPGSVLLVDDDRWYPVDAAYRSALGANGISYDMWRVPTSWAGPEPATPSAGRLSWYPQVMWFTGYDWYQTITISNEQALADYLARGGRVLISSQNYHSDLWSQELTDFSRRTLGILDRALDLTTTIAQAPHGSLLDGITSMPLKPPYPKYIAALAPQPDAQVIAVGDHGWPIALAHDMGISKTLFLSFGFEGLPPALQPDVMNRFVGYLSWLGRSGVTFDRAAAQPGESVTTTFVMINDGPTVIDQSAFTATLPPSATLLSGDALTWSGSLLPGQALTYTWQLSLTEVSAGEVISFPIELSDADHAVRFTTRARLPIVTPQMAIDLSVSPRTARVYTPVTWTLAAHNFSPITTEAIITADLPFSLTMLTGTLTSSVGVATELSGTIRWQGVVGPQDAVTLTYQVTMPLSVSKRLWYGSAVAAVSDEVWQANAWISSQPYALYLPVFRK